MGKLIKLPGLFQSSPSRNDLVEDATELVMKEIQSVFEEQDFKIGRLWIWHRDIRDYFWKEEFKLENSNFKEQDVHRWKKYWRDKALKYIQSKRIG